MGLDVKNIEVDGKLAFQLSGVIDEEATFPEVPNMPAEAIVDLKHVSAINSVGIRAWIVWFGQFQNTHFTFINCPKALVMQMNMVEGFLPEKSDVLSLEVPFFCEDCDKEIDVLFKVGKEILIENGQVRLNFDKSSVCTGDCDPELDVSEVKFFRFLMSRSGSEAA